MLAPIILFVFNRPRHTRRTLEALASASGAGESPLFIFSDAPKGDEQRQAVDEVRQLCRSVRGFASVTLIEREENYGLARNIVDGVSQVIAESERAIVLEDDLITSPCFIRYMNSALDFYEATNAWSISGYTPPISLPTGYDRSTYAIPRNSSWGWATWRNRWEMVDWQVADFDDFISDEQRRRSFNQAGDDLSPMLLRQMTGEINSWSIRFCYSGFKQQMPTIYPVQSFIRNGGVDGSGTHMKHSSRYESPIASSFDSSLFTSDLTIRPDFLKPFASFYNTSLVRRLINLIKRHNYLTRH